MQLILKKPIVFFDLETTGLNIATDRIVEISILKIDPGGKHDSLTLRVNPEMPIGEKATEIHGITDEDVAEAHTFTQVAKNIAHFIEGCDLAGYNAAKFDVPMLAEEFLRADIDIDLKRSKIIDVQNIFYKMEPRTLTAAYKFYCNKNLDQAHSAEADTKATYEILLAQVERYDELNNNPEELAKFSTQKRNVDFAGRIVMNEDGVEVFNFGKHNGKPVEQVLKDEPSYYNWMMNGAFPMYTKKVMTEIKLRQMNK